MLANFYLAVNFAEATVSICFCITNFFLSNSEAVCLLSRLKGEKVAVVVLLPTWICYGDRRNYSYLQLPDSSFLLTDWPLTFNLVYFFALSGYSYNDFFWYNDSLRQRNFMNTFRLRESTRLEIERSSEIGRVWLLRHSSTIVVSPPNPSSGSREDYIESWRFWTRSEFVFFWRSSEVRRYLSRFSQSLIVFFADLMIEGDSELMLELRRLSKLTGAKSSTSMN